MAEEAAAVSTVWRYYTLDADLRVLNCCPWLHDFWGRDMRGVLISEFPGVMETFGESYRRALEGETVTGHLNLFQGVLYESNTSPTSEGGVRVTFRDVVTLDVSSRGSLIETLAKLSKALEEWEAQAAALPADGEADRQPRVVPLFPAAQMVAAVAALHAVALPL